MTKLQTLIAKLAGIPMQPEKPIPTPPLIARDTSDFRLNDWRKSKSLVESSRLLHQNKTWRLEIEVLQNESPGHTVLALGLSPNDRVVQQGRIEGYEMCLNNLSAFAKPLNLPERLTSTFEAPEKK